MAVLPWRCADVECGRMIHIVRNMQFYQGTEDEFKSSHLCVGEFFSPYLLYIAKELLFSVKLALQSPDVLLGSGC